VGGLRDDGGRDDAEHDQASADAIVFRALWSGVVNDFDNDERHAKFLDHAHRTDRLLDAARRYSTLKDDPELGAQAKKRLEAISMLATHAMLATKTARRTQLPAWLYVLTVVVCTSLLGWVAIAAWRAQH
jgi:hypothetical protein